MTGSRTKTFGGRVVNLLDRRCIPGRRELPPQTLARTRSPTGLAMTINL